MHLGKTQIKFDFTEFCHDAAEKIHFSAFTAPKFGFSLDFH